MNHYFAAPPPTTTTATTTIAAPNPPATTTASFGTVFGVLVFCVVAFLAVTAGVKFQEPLTRYLTRSKIARGGDIARLSEIEDN